MAYPFQPGFRLSRTDVAVLVAGAVVVAVLGPELPAVAFVIAFALGHFFLFCNVFRIARPLELLWAAIFTSLAAATVSSGIPRWPTTIIIALTTTVAVVLVEMRKPSYHGLGWRQINPRLPEWWDSREVSRREFSEHVPKSIA